MPEGSVQFLQPFRHPSLTRHPLHLLPEHLVCYRRTPELLERNTLLEVSANLLLQEGARYSLLERLSRPDLVGIVDALDGFLGLDAVLEGQIAGSRLAHGRKRKAE